MTKIKDIYNQAQDDKNNQAKGSGEVKMPWSDFYEEHLCLIKTLREGSREELLAEAKDQEDELEEELKARNMTMADIENENEED